MISRISVFLVLVVAFSGDAREPEGFLMSLWKKTYEKINPPEFVLQITKPSFSFYTNKNPKIPLIVNPETNDNFEHIPQYFNAEKPTYFIIHGWISTMQSDMPIGLLEAYLKHDVNVIVVDWSDITLATYGYASTSIDIPALRIVTIIETLQNTTGIDLDKVTLIGYSLGAHVAGLTGRTFKGTIGAIVALDAVDVLPSLEEFKLAPTDAKHVLAIHTNAGELGYPNAVGTADFYIGDGTNQPGCATSLIASICSHERSWRLFAESINSRFGFWGMRCASVDDARSNDPNFETDVNGRYIYAKMGGLQIDRSVKGIYNLDTHDSSPFSLRYNPYSFCSSEIRVDRV